MPRDAGKLFDDYIAKAHEMELPDEAYLRRLQDSVVLRVMTLSENGAISARWGSSKRCSMTRTSPPGWRRPSKPGPRRASLKPVRQRDLSIRNAL